MIVQFVQSAVHEEKTNKKSSVCIIDVHLEVFFKNHFPIKVQALKELIQGKHLLFN